MNRIIRSLTVLLAFALATQPTLIAQNLAVRTTAAAAVTTTAQTIRLTSATGVVVGTKLWVNRELMRVTSIANTPTVGVHRGEAGLVTAHDSGDSVMVVNENAGEQHFYDYDPDFGAACVRGSGQARSLPWVNTMTGTVWNCRAAGTWSGTRIDPRTESSDPTAYTG